MADGFEDKIAPFPGVEAFARRPSRFTLEDFDTLQPGSLQWRVKGLWPAVGVCFVGGPSMSGKSFWALDALAKVCRGEDVLGRKSKPAGCVYIAAEGAEGVKNRIAGLRSRIGPLGGAFQFMADAPNLREPDEVEDVKDTIREAKAMMEARGQSLGVVVVDTLSASIPGADENSAADMSPVLAELQKLARELRVVVVVVAHTGKDETRGLRGWSGLLANADGVIMLESPDGETRVGNVVKVKDGKSGDRFAFTLDQVQLGFDEDGDEITTCVVEPEDAPERPKAGRKATIAQANADTIKQAFNRISETKSVRVQNGPAKGKVGVHVEDLRAEALAMGLGPPEPDYASLDERQRKAVRKSWIDHRNKTFARALRELQASDRNYRVENEVVFDAAQNKGALL